MNAKSVLLGFVMAAAISLAACGGGGGNHFLVSNLKGTYTFYANGHDSNGYPVCIAGSIDLDGNGNVTGGEQDYFDAESGNEYPADAVTGGTITIGSDGRGTLTVTPTSAPSETYSVVQVNAKHLLVTEFDSNATSGGSMDLQTVPTSVPSGGDAFETWDVYYGPVFGGVLTSTGTAITGEGDEDIFGNFAQVTYQGSIASPPDSNGRGTLTLVDSGGVQAGFAYYVVGPEVFRLIEMNAVEGLGDYQVGSIYGQGTAAGAFSAASLKGSFVFSQQGAATPGVGEYGVAGEFTTDGVGTFTAGVADVNEGDGTPIVAGDISQSTFGVSSDGYGSISLAPTGQTDTLANFGVYMVDPGLNITDPNNTTGGGGALMTDLDVNSNGIGFLVPQTSGATFSGNYAFSQDGYYATVSNSSFFDLIGRLNSNGSSKLTGTVDFNDIANTGLNSALAVTGNFAADTGNPGRSTAQLSIGGAANSPENVTIYRANSDLALHVDTDSPANGQGNNGVGVLEKQQ